MAERYTVDGSALLDSGFHIGDLISAEHAERIAAALNAQPQPRAEPVGEWVMVPREPTLAMLGAGRAKARDGYTLEAAWEAMLAAAPDRGGA